MGSQIRHMMASHTKLRSHTSNEVAFTSSQSRNAAAEHSARSVMGGCYDRADGPGFAYQGNHTSENDSQPDHRAEYHRRTLQALLVSDPSYATAAVIASGLASGRFDHNLHRHRLPVAISDIEHCLLRKVLYSDSF